MKTKPKLTLLILATAVRVPLALPVFAANAEAANSTDAEEIAALKKEIQALEEKVNRLEQNQSQAQPSVQVGSVGQKIRVPARQSELDQDAAVAAAKTQPNLSLGANGFVLSSADSNFAAQLHGWVQADSRAFFHDGGLNGNDGFLLRRARPVFTGTVFRDFDFNFTPDFGGNTVQIVDAYLNYRYSAALQLEAGKFKSPVGLEQLQSDIYTPFNERSLATDLVPYRDLGILLHGNLFDGAVSYALGLVNGDTDLNTTTVNAPFQDDKAFTGRVFFQPWKNSDVNALRALGFGVSGGYLANHPQTSSSTGLTPGYTTDGQQKFFTFNSGVNANGAGWRISPQAYYYYGPFSLLGEYVISDQQVASVTKSANLHNTAWEISGGWILTGEDASYNGVTPRHPFDPRTGQWGAWQLVARYAALDVDGQAFTDGFASSTKSAVGANAWSVGLNWYLNKNLRANLSFSHTDFNGFTGRPVPGVVPAQPENVLFSRMQLAF